jgi:MtN3 and saliva related transmembrane protein
MAQTGLALAASSWGVLMGIAPVLQIHRMLREQSSRDLSLGYCAVLLIGFLLWIAYGLTMGNLALVIPNSVALAVGIVLMLVALRLRRPLARTTRPGLITGHGSGGPGSGGHTERPGTVRHARRLR